MGRLCIAVAECNYREAGRQLKEQFIHGLNDKAMLDEVIGELATKGNNDQMSSKDVLVWAKRTEVQWAQAAILNEIAELQNFHKFKMAQNPKGMWKQYTQAVTNTHADIVMEVMHPGSVQHMEKCALDVEKLVTSRRYAGVGGTMQFMKCKLRWCRNHKKKE